MNPILPVIPVGTDRRPASFAQRRMWFLHALEPDSALYNIPVVLQRQAPFDPAVFQRAMDELVRRHESLRTTFVLEDSEPMQVVAHPSRQHVAVIDLRDLPDDQRMLAAQSAAFQESRAPFDLERGPLLRISVVLLGEADHLMLFTFHHIIADGGSLQQFFGELEAIEAAFKAGQPSPLDEPLAQYADYARWQRERLSGPALEEHVRYWRGQLAGAPALVELPLDRPRPKQQRFAGATLPVVLDKDIVDGLKALCRETHATLFMALLAGFFALLHRFTRQTDIVLGTPIALRQRPEFESLIGLFVNMLVLRADLSDRPSVFQFMERVRDLTLDAYAHQELPFEYLVEELQPERSLSHQPLVQAVLVMQNAIAAGGGGPAAADAQAPDSQATPVPSVAKFDLTLSLAEHGGQLIGGVEYDTDLFDAATILQLIERLKHLLRGMAADSSRSIAAIPLLDDAERQHMLAGINRTERVWPNAKPTIVEHIWEQAEREPDKTAVVLDDGGSLTYRELVDWAEVIASRLTAMGPMRGRLVPVCFNRSLELMAGLLGILRAGAAYVPLDPDHPAQRLAFMVEDIGAQVALASRDMCERLPSGIDVLMVERGQAPAPDGVAGNLPAPADLAYAIFTSGSTGKPKCAANEHGALLNRLLWMQQAFPLQAGDRVLQKTPYTFDVSVWELFWPLMFGSTVVFARPADHGDPAYVAGVIVRQDIAVTHFVPSMLRAFLGSPMAPQCVGLRRVITSGEALPGDLVEAFHSHLSAELHNLYGPTECAIDVTHWPCVRGQSTSVIPIGYPVANTRIYILDPDTLEPVPPGARGELYIAGQAVGRGYVNRPELNAASFLPDVLAPASGARMYRSGDLARYRVDASIEYLGRIDQQLKLRGFRIEAGEVEETLRRAPGVLDAAVSIRSSDGFEQQLVAHCVPDEESGRTIRTLLHYERDGRLQDRIVQEMENGLTVVARSRSETDFVYQEIFSEQAYLSGGISLEPDSVVFDVGANIGLFSLFVGMNCPGAKVYSFEPGPETFDLLEMNVGLHPWDVVPRQVAIGREPGVAKFTYYPHVSILSGLYADAEEERQTVLAYEHNLGHEGPEVEQLVRERLESASFNCSVMTISQVIAEEKLERIDLLKVDVEKSEQDVLAGITPADWSRIRHVAVEVHEIGPRLAEVCGVLHRNGFTVEVEQGRALRGTRISMIFARRPDVGGVAAHADPPVAVPISPSRLREQIRGWVAKQLPEYMVPSRILWLDALPRLTSGKVDRKSLPEDSAWQVVAGAGARSEPPRTQLEIRIAEIWSELLGRDVVFGRNDNFFMLGGHSLLATSAIARIRDLLHIEVSVRSFFTHPTVAGLAQHIDSGDAQQSELQEMIPRVERGPEEWAPLSFSQQRLWFLDRFSPGDVAYNIPAVLVLPGIIDVPVLERSLTEIVRRHEVLRTSFPFIHGRPVQRISSDPTVRLRRIDLSTLDSDNIQDEVHALSLREVQRPFDLANGPLFRALLIKAAPDQHHLVMTMHHTVSDGWSMGVLFRELATLYETYSRGEPSPLSELPVQFADFAAWQQRWMTGEVLDRQLSYWREELTGAPKLLPIPTDLARPPVRSSRGDIHLFDIDTRTYAQLSEFAQQESCTPFMAMLTVYVALLHRLSRAQDICVGTPIANRRRPELEGMIGFFVNTIVLRLRWDGAPSFRDLLREARNVTLGAFAHQDMPFEYLVAELEPERSMDRSPLFQAMLILQNIAGWDSTGLVESRPVLTGAAKFDLSLYLLPMQTGLAGMLEYRTDLFGRETAACMMRQFCELMAQVVKAPDEPISRLPLLTGEPQEMAQTPTPPSDDLVERVKALAQRAPEMPATVWGSTNLSYAELVRRADDLAERLHGLGIRPGDVVAIAVDLSPDLIASVLAVRQLDAAYLVLDPADPPARLAALAGSAARLVLVAGTFDEAGDLPVLDIASESGLACDPRPVDPMPNCAALLPVWDGEGPILAELDPQALAWRLEHSPLRDFADQAMACATLPWTDAAVSTLAAIYHGGSLVLPPRDPVAAPRSFARTLTSSGARVVIAEPDVLHAMAKDFARALEGVEIVVALADPIQIDGLRRVLPSALLGHCRWGIEIAGFGWVSLRTTAGTDSIVLDVEDGAAVLALAAEHELVPLSAYGDLAFTGPGLATARSGRAGLSLPGQEHPLLQTGVPVVHSAAGDVRLRSEGELLRRAFADVEHAISLTTGGAEAAVTLDDESADLIGFAVRSPGAAEAPIQRELETWLPPSRRPKAIRLTGVFLRRADGSVDVRGLMRRSQIAGVPFVAPRTELEHEIARIWTEALRVERVGIHDDFFALGGHSLLAAHVIARLSTAFQAEIPLRTLFEHPTIEALSKEVEKLSDKEPGADELPLERSTDDRPAPLAYAQQQLWFLNRYEPQSAFYNVVGGLPLQGRIDEIALERALNALIARHDALRLVFTVVDWEPLQHALPELHVAVSLIDLRSLDAERRRAEVTRLRDEIARQPFDLERSPLLRAQLLRLEDDAHIFLLSMHHIVADGWSMGILFHELGALYRAFASGQRADLPELPIRYTDYARWQRAWLTGEVLGRHLAFWHRMLVGASPLLQIPGDRFRPPVQMFEGGLYQGMLDSELIRPLRELARSERATSFMILFAAYAATLSRYTGSEDIVVGMPIANRRRSELAGLIGLVANTLVLRVSLSGTPTFRELVARVRTATLEAYEHQDTPFEKLVEELQPERDPSFNPIFQVMLTHQTTAEQEPATQALGQAAELPLTGAAKFDFTMFLMERPHEISVGVEYNAHLFNAETVDHLVDHFERLLRQGIREPHRRLTELDLLAPGERREAPTAPSGETVVAALNALVKRRPDQPAIVTEGATLSLDELWERAGRCAAALQSATLPPESTVGICVTDPLQELVAMLGVLRAGGACLLVGLYEPLPALRAHLAEAATVVADRHTGPMLAGVRPVVMVDALPDFASISDTAPVSPSATAIISESGMRITHAALAASVAAEIEDAALADDSRTLIAELRPSLVLHDALAVWLAGCAVVAADVDAREEPSAFVRLVRETNAARAYVSADLVRQLASSGESDEAFTGLKSLIADYPIGLTADSIGGLRDRLANATVLERMALHGALPALRLWSATPERPTAKPRTHLPVTVMDAGSQLVPDWMPGMLHLALPGLAQEALPTGVLGRVLSEGAIQLLGRAAAQLRVRGHVVDRDVVEAALRALPGVMDAGVAVRGQNELVAFVQGNVSETQVQLALGRTLPAFMVPTTVVRVQGLPRNGFGEIAHDLLTAQRPADNEDNAGRTHLERVVAKAFAEVLDRDRVDLDEDLLLLGGRHRAAHEIAERISEATGIKVFAADVLLNGTVGQLTIALTQQSLTDADETEQLLAELESLDDDDVDLLLREEMAERVSSPSLNADDPNRRRGGHP